MAFISGSCNRRIGATPPASYFKKLHEDRFAEQWLPADPTLWELDNFEDFLIERREAQAQELNELLDLPPHAGRSHGVEGEVPDDEETVEETDDF